MKALLWFAPKKAAIIAAVLATAILQVQPADCRKYSSPVFSSCWSSSIKGSENNARNLNATQYAPRHCHTPKPPSMLSAAGMEGARKKIHAIQTRWKTTIRRIQDRTKNDLATASSSAM